MCRSQEQQKNLIKFYFKRSQNVTQEIENKKSFWPGELWSKLEKRTEKVSNPPSRAEQKKQ